MYDKVAFVTGAAGGIGGAVASSLGEAGARVAAVDRDAQQLGDTVAKLTGHGLDVAAFPGDISDSGVVDDLVGEVENRIGPIDYLVNGAGILRLGEVASIEDGQWSEMFAVNASGVFFVSRAVVSRMIERRRGAIVTVASNAAGTARMRMAAYGASKAAATSFTKSLALEVAQYGIRCNVVAPGSTDTEMLSSMWQDASGRQSTIDGSPSSFKVGIPLGKLAVPEDIADAVMFLLSDSAGHVTMHDLTVDGGATLGV